MYQLSRSDTASSAQAGAASRTASERREHPVHDQFPPCCCCSDDAELTSPVSLRGVPGNDETLHHFHREIDREPDRRPAP